MDCINELENIKFENISIKIVPSKLTIIYHLFNMSIRNIIDPRINFSRNCVRVRQISVDHISIIKCFYRRCVTLSGQYIIIDINS